MTAGPVIALDFDGVISSYTSGWQGVIPTDPPTPGAREACVTMRAAGYRVVVFTCRALSYEGRRAVQAWLALHGIEVDEVTGVKPHALLYVDDRAHRFEGPDDWLVLSSWVRSGRLPGPWNAAAQKPRPWDASTQPRCPACLRPVSEVDSRGRFACGHLSAAAEEIES